MAAASTAGKSVVDFTDQENIFDTNALAKRISDLSRSPSWPRDKRAIVGVEQTAKFLNSYVPEADQELMAEWCEVAEAALAAFMAGSDANDVDGLGNDNQDLWSDCPLLLADWLAEVLENGEGEDPAVVDAGRVAVQEPTSAEQLASQLSKAVAEVAIYLTLDESVRVFELDLVLSLSDEDREAVEMWTEDVLATVADKTDLKFQICKELKKHRTQVIAIKNRQELKIVCPD